MPIFHDPIRRVIELLHFLRPKSTPLIEIFIIHFKIPVTASLSVSFVSAITIIGVPVEVYWYGSVYLWDILSEVISKLVAVAWYLPIYHRLQLKSIYEVKILIIFL